MADAYNTWSAGRDITYTRIQEWIDAQGAINNVGFRPQQPVAYTIFGEDSTYYRRDGKDGEIDDSSTNALTLINNAIDAATGGSQIVLKVDPTAHYPIAGTVDLKANRMLRGETSSVSLDPSTDADVIDFHSGAQLKDIQIWTEPLAATFTKSAINIEPYTGDTFWTLGRQFIEGVRLYGKANTAGTTLYGTAINIESLDTTNDGYMAGLLVQNIKIYGFEYGIHMKRTGAVAGDNWLNSNHFDHIFMENVMKGIHLEDPNVAPTFTGLNANKFTNIQYTLNPVSYANWFVMKCQGIENVFDINIWDYDITGTSETMCQFLASTAKNRLEVSYDNLGAPGGYTPLAYTNLGANTNVIVDRTLGKTIDVKVITIEHHTAADTLLKEESGSVHTNLGAGGNIKLDLPQDATAGTQFEFVVMTAGQQLQVDAGAAGAIYINGAKQADDALIWADDEGESVKLVCDGNNDWIALYTQGTWTVV